MPNNDNSTSPTVVPGRVVGKVLMRETSTGVPNLVVGLWEAHSKHEEGYHSSSTVIGRRLVSGFTGPTGEFELLLPLNQAEQGGQTQEPTGLLALIIDGPSDKHCKPEGTSLSCGPPPSLHCTLIHRPYTGSTEAVLVRLGRDLLVGYGIIPKPPEGGQVPVPTPTRNEQVAKIEEKRTKFRDDIRPKLRQALASRFISVPGRVYADPNKPIAQTIEETARDGITRLPQRVTMPRITLSAEQIRLLGGNPDSPSQTFEPKLGDIIKLIQKVHPARIQRSPRSQGEIKSVLDEIEEHLFGSDDNG